MKTENKSTKYRFKFPKLSFKERMQLLGFAKYMGYDFQYDKDKRKAILVKTNNGKRKVLYLAKISGSIIGIDKDGNTENLDKQMYISKMLYESGIFKIPKDVSIGINDYLKQNLSLITE